MNLPFLRTGLSILVQKNTSKCLELKLCKKYIHSCLTKYDNFSKKKIHIYFWKYCACLDNRKLYETFPQNKKSNGN